MALSSNLGSYTLPGRDSGSSQRWQIRCDVVTGSKVNKFGSTKGREREDGINAIGVAVNVGCWSHRRGHIVFDKDLNFTVDTHTGFVYEAKKGGKDDGSSSRKWKKILVPPVSAEDLKDCGILHAGSIIRPLGDEKYEMVSVGPTTSMRMEKFEYEFVKETGVRVIVGIRKDSCAGVHRSFSVLQISSFRLS